MMGSRLGRVPIRAAPDDRGQGIPHRAAACLCAVCPPRESAMQLCSSSEVHLWPSDLACTSPCYGALGWHDVAEASHPGAIRG